MAKKAFIVALILVAGVLIGGTVAFYVLNGKAHIGQSNTPMYAPKAEISPSQAGSFPEVVSRVFPAVVNISTVKVYRRTSQDDPFFDFFNDFFGRFNDEAPKRWKEQNLGSGVVVSTDGYILTNNHVVADAEHIDVTLYDKRTLKGKVVGSDPKTDIAVVKIDAVELPAIPWGDSDSLKVGEFVLAIGNPFGLSHTVTMGIISAVGRANVGIAEYEDFIQTDAAINPGNSGGPLVDTSGRLIGINTAIFSKSGGYQGIGFAVPSNMAKLLMEELIREGRVVRGWLGVTIQDLTPELGRKFGFETTAGALVDEVIAGSPAQKGGIRKGDIVTHFGGKEVENPSVLKNLVAGTKPGTQVMARVFRGKKTVDMTLTITEPPSEQDKQAQPAEPDARLSVFSGLKVMNMTEDVAKQLGIDASDGGVVVLRVQAGSPLEDAGLRRGDVIFEIDRKPIKGVNEFNRAASEVRPDDTVLLYIGRGGRKFFMTVSS